MCRRQLNTDIARSAGLIYLERLDGGLGFVADERGGTWGTAINGPGLDLAHANSEVDSVSCTSAGNCAATGIYDEQPYGSGSAASEQNGVWDELVPVDIGGRFAGASAVSCASPGNCAAGGYYSNASGGIVQAWVAVERHGRWGKAIGVPGLGP